MRSGGSTGTELTGATSGVAGASGGIGNTGGIKSVGAGFMNAWLLVSG